MSDWIFFVHVVEGKYEMEFIMAIELDTLPRDPIPMRRTPYGTGPINSYQTAMASILEILFYKRS